MIKNLAFFLLSIAVFLFSGITPEVAAQPSYKAEGKVFTDLEKAMLQPDSVFRLKLRRRGYTEIPQDVFLFKNLKELDLGNNRIILIPSEIVKLQKLEILILERNRLTSVSKEAGELKALRYLDLGLNKIVALPAEISELENLEFLQIWGNELTVLPPTLSKLEKLKWLDMRAIILSPEERNDITELVPGAQVLLSPECNCGK